MIRYPILFVAIVFFLSCRKNAKPGQLEMQSLPFLGSKIDTAILVDGLMKDTFFYHSIPDFSLINQDGDTVTSKIITNKVYVAEFFFTSCPSTCPKVSVQLQKVYQKFMNEDEFMILSHSVDPKRDTPERLSSYAAGLGVNTKQWCFLTGNKEDIYDLANYSYDVIVYEDDQKLKDNILHGGTLVLIDKRRRTRGMYNGTDPDDADRLIEDIRFLIADQE